MSIVLNAASLAFSTSPRWGEVASSPFPAKMRVRGNRLSLIDPPHPNPLPAGERGRAVPEVISSQ
jgi:hypothetical protein